MTKMTANLLFLSALVVSGALAEVACGGKPAEAPPTVGTVGQEAPTAAEFTAAPANAVRLPAAAAAGTGSASAAPPSGSAPPLAASLPTEAATIQKLFDDTSHAAAATLKVKGAAGDDPIAKGLREIAKKAAPGMEPDGPLATGILKEKQKLQTEVTLQPGRCYAIVGYSRGVKDLDVYLLLAPGILSGQDTTDDNSPVIGGSPQPMCPVAATPVRYRLGIVADRGAGEVAVQLYSKAP